MATVPAGDESSTAVAARLGQLIDPLGLNKAHPEYPELAIKMLPPHLQVQMAQLTLAGYRFWCTELTPVRNRWWNVRYNSEHLSGCGGRDLRDVIRRAAEHHAKYGVDWLYRGGNEGRNAR